MNLSMRVKMICFFVLSSLLLISCSSSDTTSEVASMDNFMKISTKIVNPALIDTGYWAYDASLIGRGSGYWVSEDGKEYATDEVFIRQELEPGVVYTMAPISFDKLNEGYNNLHLHFDFDGILEIETEDPTDNSVRLAYFYPQEDATAKCFGAEENPIRVNAPVSIQVCPVGKKLFTEGLYNLGIRDTLIGTECTLYARAYEHNGTLAVSAEIKLTAMDDPHYPWETVHEGHYAELYKKGEVRTRFMTIEIVSYEYSDLYKLMG